jgi:hypothetical protein
MRIGGMISAPTRGTTWRCHEEIGIADLKARLSEHLRAVRKGRTITVLDRDRPATRRPPPVIAYVDTSALLRLVLREAGALEELRSCTSSCFQ